VNRDSYAIPEVELDPDSITLAMVSEAAPKDRSEHFYCEGDPLYQETTVQAFQDAGVDVSSAGDLLDLGVYLTTAVKCGKTEYGVKSATIKECSMLLGEELALFPGLKVIMLMGDVSIKAINYIAKRAGDGRVIPARSTYRIRSGEFSYQGRRVFPSYLQAGPSFFIEKSKRRMIAEDIAAAMKLLD
jgi:uracil-DNA glycosylase